MIEKYVGYGLLVTGIIIMIFATIQIVMVITGRVKPFAIVNYRTNTTIPTKPVPSSNNIESIINQYKSGADITGEIKNNIPPIDVGSALGTIVDTTSINQIVNLTLYYLIMQFVLGLGFKISSLGTQLVRPVIIKVDKSRVENTKETLLNT